MNEAVERRDWWKLAIVSVVAIELLGGLSGWLAGSGYGNAWFDALLHEHGYTHLATAHHFDDTMETMLLHWTRGGTVDGLAGIPVKNRNVIRPLLFATRAQVEAYVAGHPAAAEELEQLQDAAVWLAVSGAPASRDLWEKISAATKPEPAPLRFPDRRRASWFTPRRVLALAAAFVLVVAVAVGVVVSRDDSGSQTDLAAMINKAQFSRDARRIHLESSSGDARAEAVMLPNGTGFLVSADLPKLGSDRTYQLWAIDGSTVVSLGVLGPDLGPSAFKFVGSPKTLAITDEVAGGVAQPQSKPLVSGRVPA